MIVLGDHAADEGQDGEDDRGDVDAEDPAACDCGDIYNPVCSLDGATYENVCFSACEGAELALMGECDTAPDGPQSCQ